MSSLEGTDRRAFRALGCPAIGRKSHDGPFGKPFAPSAAESHSDANSGRWIMRKKQALCLKVIVKNEMAHLVERCVSSPPSSRGLSMVGETASTEGVR